MPSYIACPVHENAERSPQAEAIRWSTGGRAISWEGLAHYVSATVRHFKEFGVRTGDRVILAAGFDPSFVIVVLSLWRMGLSVFVPHPGMDDFELAAIVERLGPRLMITDKKRRIGLQQLLVNEAVALEEIKDFWYGSEQAGPQLDTSREALVLIEDERCVSMTIEDLFTGRRAQREAFLGQIIQGLRSGEAIVV